jgi:zinc protease
MKKALVMMRMMTLALLILYTASAVAQLNPADPLPLDPKVKTGKLENGLTYYIRQNKKPEQKVELRLVLNAGSINEDDDQQGLAHMAEHMAFNGTKNFKKNDIVSFLQDIGVGFGNDLNAYTSFDETVYILPIPTDKPGNLEKGFQVLEDWAHGVTYVTEDIDGERPIILEESRLGKGANDRMFKKIYPKLFAGSKYGKRLPIGQDSIIKNFQHDAIRRFYKDWYRPNLMAVVVVGDIEPAKAEQMIRKHFAGLKNPSNERKREYAEVLPYGGSEAIVSTDKEATNYSVSIQYPFVKDAPSTTVADYKNDLTERIFTSLLNQRLQELTQKENPPFIGAGVNFGSYARGYNGFSAYAGAGTGDVNKALDALVEEIERAKRYGFTASELDRARKNLLSFYERLYNDRDKTESDNYVDEYVEHFLEAVPSPGIEKEYEYAKALLPAITLEEVNAVSRKFKDEKNRFVYVMGPEAKGNEKLPEGTDLLAAIAAKEKADIKPYEEKVIAANLVKNTPKSGKVVAKTNNARLGTTELKLSNGVTVTLKRTDFKNDQVLMNAGRFGGKSNYKLEDKFNAEYAVQVANAMGVGDFAPLDLRKALAGKTVSVTPSFGQTTEGLNGNSTVKDLETMFQLAHLYMTAPRMDTALFKSFVQRNKSQFANLSANPQVVFFDTLYKTLYNGNPLAPVAVPNSSYFDRINLDRSMAIYKERFTDASGMHFVFTGSFTEEQIIPYIEKYIASLPASGKKFNYTDNKVRTVAGKKELTVSKGKEQKSMILAIYTGEIPYSQDLDLKAQVLSEILNIRIIEELREKVQGIYGGGTFAQLEKEPYSNYTFMLQLPCGPEKVDTLIKAVRKEFSDIVANGPQQSYLDKVKKQLTEQDKVAMKQNNTWSSFLLDAAMKKHDPKYFLEYEKLLNSLTVKDIQNAAKIFLAGKNQFTAVLMPETVEKEGEKKKGF